MGDETFSIEDLGREVALSRSQLHRKIKALTDQSPSVFLRTIRLKRAHQLLSEKAASIAEISFLVGFSSPAYFSKCFKDQFGYSPKWTIVNSICSRINLPVSQISFFIRKSDLRFFPTFTPMLNPLKITDGEVLYDPTFLLKKKVIQLLFQRLLDKIEWRQEDILIFGKKIPQPRLIAWHGDKGISYSYSHLHLTASPWTDDLLAIKSKIELATEF